jgi:hypothetical protein
VDPDTFNAIDPLLDQIAEIAEKQFNTDELRGLVAEFANLLGQGKAVTVSVVVDVLDEDKEASIPLLTTGLSAFHSKELFRSWGDSSPQRYVVEGEIKVVPNDYCPHCWHRWDFKLQNLSCPNCGITMGDQCKLLLDTDECPWCNEGKVTVAQPRCDKCGFEVHPTKVVCG